MSSLKSLKLWWLFPIPLAFLSIEPILTKTAASSQIGLEKSFSCKQLALNSIGLNFGRNGRSGIDGARGRDGAKGRDRTIFVDGKEIELDLSGQDGGHGQDGSHGGNAVCYGQPFYGNHNVYGSTGGNGGDGGNGGNGGDGGDLTVYYNDLDLQKIYVQALGGRGGEAGRGGYSGSGCQCSQFSWTQKVCTGTPGYLGYHCTIQNFSCISGTEGISGTDGQHGRDGRLGRLRIIHGSEPLADDRPSAEVSLSQLQNKIVPLSLNIWETKDGARSLLASGSQIDNRYSKFIERLERNFELVWQAKQPLTGVGEENLTVTLDKNKQIKVLDPEDVWLSSTLSKLEDTTQYIVAAVVRRSEVTKLTRADFKGNKSALNFVVVDRAGKSDILETEFEIKYRTATDGDRFDYDRRYRTRYEGQIPSELVSRSRHRFVLNLGKLPIKEGFLRTGVPVEIELVITRSLGERSAQQIINWRGVIR